MLHAGSVPEHRPRAVGLPRLRRGRAGARARLGAVPRTAGDRGHDRHPLRDALEPLRRALQGRAVERARAARAAEAERALRRRACRAGVHGERAARRAGGSERPARLRGRRRAADQGARLAAPPRSSRRGTSGRAPSGCAAWSCAPPTSPGSGSGTATTTTPTTGKKSGTSSKAGENPARFASHDDFRRETITRASARHDCGGEARLRRQLCESLT